MARFFIDRPVFAWVLAIFIILAGVLAIPRLAVERYPAVAPPSVSIYASYPGASPQTLNDAVVGLIERELSSVKHLLYFESSVDTSGEASITATFKPGTNPELAQVDVQNRIKAIEPRLPRSVRQNGLFVEAADSGFLMLVGLRSPDASVSEAALGDFMARNIIEELRRIDGVGRVQLFGAEQAMRVWLDPTRLTGYGLTMGDVAAAIEQQNLEISPGRIGDSPGVPGQRITVPLSADGQLSTPEQFAAIVLRAGADGSRVLLGDVARVERCPAAPEADLRQPRPLAHQDREGARTDLGIERAVIAGLDPVEAAHRHRPACRRGAGSAHAGNPGSAAAAHHAPALHAHRPRQRCPPWATSRRPACRSAW
jgi:multidrug efflux pump